MLETSGKIQQLTVRGFKSIRQLVNFNLGDTNILIGQNGSGKSNFVGIFKFLLKMAYGELDHYVSKSGGANRILHFSGKFSEEMEIFALFERAHYHSVLDLGSNDKLEILIERGHLGGDSQSVRVATTPPGYQDTEGPTSLRKFYKAIVGFKVYHFHDTTENSRIRSTSDTVEMDTLLSDGANLAAFLYYLQEKYPASLDRIEAAVRSIAPFFRSFLLKPDPLNERYIRLRWRHVGAEQAFDVADLSDGMLRFIALATLLLQPNPPPTIIIDEPELGLHPAAIAQLAAMIHQISPNVQIIAATQSPTFANYFSWQDFIVVERENEASTFRRLKEEEVKPWLDEFAMGAIWEMNLIGGQPK